jgi:DNA segregation ATPase FtsK/SpoIIIE, S-DNA-T family
VTDLDAATTRRAASSLGAELRRRERILAEHGAADIDALGDGVLARLVVVIDEFAALVGEHPELHDIVGDLAARGRSLGVHLVLGTQRPAGVVRDGVLANAALRLSLRVTAAADSTAVLGVPDAAALPPAPRGRAVLAGADGHPRLVQIAVSSREDVRTVAERWAGAPRAWRPWAEPPAARIPWDDVAAPGSPGAFGVLDVPERQRTEPARLDQRRDGNVLVVGGRGAGVSTALAALARASGLEIAIVPAGVADAWGMLARHVAAPSACVVVADDVDALLAAADEEERIELVGLLAAVGRALPACGGLLLLGAARVPPTASALLAVVDSRLLLGLPDRDAHVLAGGAGAAWRRRRPGSGVWRDREVQVALAPGLPPPAEPDIARFVPPAEGWAMVSARPAVTVEALTRCGIPARLLGVPAVRGPEVVVGDPESWQAEWEALEHARRAPLLVVGCTRRELRTLLRVGSAPPLDPGRPEGWLVEHRVARRVAVPPDLRGGLVV